MTTKHRQGRQDDMLHSLSSHASSDYVTNTAILSHSSNSVNYGITCWNPWNPEPQSLRFFACQGNCLGKYDGKSKPYVIGTTLYATSQPTQQPIPLCLYIDHYLTVLSPISKKSLEPMFHDLVQLYFSCDHLLWFQLTCS